MYIQPLSFCNNIERAIGKTDIWLNLTRTNFSQQSMVRIAVNSNLHCLS